MMRRIATALLLALALVLVPNVADAKGPPKQLWRMSCKHHVCKWERIKPPKPACIPRYLDDCYFVQPPYRAGER